MIATQAEMIHAHDEKCNACYGLGSVESLPNVWNACESCDGTGHIQPPVALNVRNLPRDLRNRFKAYCARRSLNMQDAIIMLMQMAVGKKIELEGDGTKSD